MGKLEDKIMDMVQKNIGKFVCEFLSQTKVVIRGDIIIDVTKNKIDTSNLYVAIVDQSTGKDVSKNTIDFRGVVKKKGLIKINVESKLTLPKRKK